MRTPRYRAMVKAKRYLGIPRSGADVRPLKQPFFIPKGCPIWGTLLVLENEEFEGEWECFKCQDRIYLDIPRGMSNRLKRSRSKKKT